MSQATDSIRMGFKECLSKLIEIDTRTQAFKEIQILISQNKTTNNLRTWLSVLSQNRKKHSQSQIQVITFIIKQYGKGLLDPLDKIPSIEKTVFRVCQLLMKFFGETQQNVQYACQAAWVELYETTLRDEPAEIKKKLLYNNLEAIINGGGGKLAQITAQIVVDGLLERALSKQDHQFFKQIAKRTLVLFLKTTVLHPSTLTCLQTILGFFNIMNLLPLLDNIVSKILIYINSSQNNSTGYKIKGEASNCFGIIGEQIDSNGVPIFQRISSVLSDMATDKVWAVQAPGRKALSIWKSKKKEWDSQFAAKNEKIGEQVSQLRIDSPLANLKENISQFPKTNQDNWFPPAHSNQYIHDDSPSYNINNNNNKPIAKTEYPSNTGQPSTWTRNPQKPQQQSNYTYQQPREPSPSRTTYQHKNTGMGGGNNVQSVQQYYERQRAQDTHQRKMQQLKKSIYNPRSEIQFEDTVVLDEDGRPRRNKTSNEHEHAHGHGHDDDQNGEEADDDFLQQWEIVLQLAQNGKFQESVKVLLEMDDDIYFLRFFLKYSPKLLGDLTLGTSNKILKKMLQIKKTNFMEQMLFKMVSESIKCGVGHMLSNSQNLIIENHLDNAKKASKLKQTAEKLSAAYERSLQC